VIEGSADEQAIADALTRADYFRRSPGRFGGTRYYKEWQHFLIHAEGLHLLINFNLNDDPWAPDARHAETARLIVLAKRENWEGDADRFQPEEVTVEAGSIDATFGRNTLRFRDGCYHVSFALRHRPIAGELVIKPAAFPGLGYNQPLAGMGTNSWLFVPRALASGEVRLDGHTQRFTEAPAYHDHNWGHFTWGDDFSWEWGSGVPRDKGNPWSVVYVRMSDRGRSIARSQALYIWHGTQPRRIFYDAQIRAETSGRLRGPRLLKVPRPMALLSPGGAHDVPQRLTCLGRADDDEVMMTFVADAAAQIIMPSEIDLTSIAVLNEVNGHVELKGRLGGEPVHMEGPGVFEFIRD
jgi:hypothetical protein